MTFTVIVSMVLWYIYTKITKRISKDLPDKKIDYPDNPNDDLNDLND